MSEVQSLNEQLRRHSDILMRDSREYAKLARDAAEKRNALDVARAKSQLKVRTNTLTDKWTVSEKEAQVTLMIETELTESKIADAFLDAMKTRLRSVEASLSSIQSQVKLLKTESKLDNYQP